MLGYAIVGLALLLSVQAKNVFPQLLLARLFFSLGGAATSTMVTAILPSMTVPRTTETEVPSPGTSQQSHGYIVSPSISSELTVTTLRPKQQDSQLPSKLRHDFPDPSPTRLAGLVGIFTGCGALVALGLFLPLPAQFQKAGVKPGKAVADAYYVVGALAMVISAVCFYGLRNLLGEENKSWRSIRKGRTAEGKASGLGQGLPFLGLFVEAVRLGYKNPLLGLGYICGFVARASSVGISLFIPLFVNAYFISSGLCDNSDRGTETMKKRCRGAYVLAAELSGTSQLVALLFAPVFGYLGDRYRHYNFPLLAAALAGVLGYSTLALLRSPEPTGVHGSPWVFVIVALLGISQIGAIVCSLSLVGRAVQEPPQLAGRTEAGYTDQSTAHSPSPTRSPTTAAPSVFASSSPHGEGIIDSEETLGLLQDKHMTANSCHHLKGSIAGVYSLAGGFGILLLTKLGGLLFDNTSPVAPFYMLSAFNAILLIAGLAYGISAAVEDR